MRFDDSFVRTLPADPQEKNFTRQVPNASYSFVAPEPVAAPRLLAWWDHVGEKLGLERPASDDTRLVQALAGNAVLAGMRPYAARYGGHQFGNWAGQLGDGRAITLGELVTGEGGRWELQLKGAGRTPYSRHADGRAVLRSSLREFLCSEAMHFLGVPTTHALSLVGTGEQVVRDMFYDGRPQEEPGAVVCRVAPTFVRFGNFEIHASLGEHEPLRRLADYVIERHFPELGAPSPEVYEAWFAQVCERTAVTLAHWMRVGFVHGVMNTDNMSILGLTIDYGPYGWLEGYDPLWTPNTTDAHGRRYAYGRQPQVAAWNLARLAGALTPLGASREALERGLETYADTFNTAWREQLAAKLGLLKLEGPQDERLLQSLFDLLAAAETDYTIFFRQLARVPLDALEGEGAAAALHTLDPALYDDAGRSDGHRERGLAWLRLLAVRVHADGLPTEERRARMDAANPKYVPRNYLAQLAIDAASAGDLRPLERLMHVLRSPYAEQPEHEELAARRPEWARDRPGCSALSCSS
jgi:serine/tyrosine/threonine adenylyltransferase